MALEGNIRDFSLADIFQLIGIQRKTGLLTLKQKNEEVAVSFLNGMVVNADSKGGRLDDRLGSVLVKSGKLTQENLERALKLQKETLKKLGNVLVENGLARPEDLRDALGIQITQIVYRLFRWKDGRYHFEQDVSVDYDKENFTPMSAESILMEGMRMIDEWPIIERKITSYEMVFELVPLTDGQEPRFEPGRGDERPARAEDDFDLIFGGDAAKPKPTTSSSGSAIRLTREEDLVYRQVNGTATVQEIIDRTMLSEFEICRSLYDLSNRNLIAPVERERKSRTDKRAPRREVSSRLVTRIGVALMVAWVIALYLLGFGARNPLNLVAMSPARNPRLAPVMEQLAVTRVQRLVEALDAYYLSEQSYPASLDKLVEVGLVDERELRDPWGRAIGFEVAADRIVVSSRTGAADDAQSVSAERSLAP